MKRLFQAVVTSLLLAGPVWAQNSPVVVELYTSQGCSSCPPADELFHQIADRDDVIALALHVDYWDYIGWKDEFADPRNADRQRAYATVGGRRSIYTPEMIVNGTTDIVGAKAMQLSDAINMHGATPSPVQVTLIRDGDSVRISASPRAGSSVGRSVVHFLRYMPRREARITRGENAGRTIDYANVTQDWKVLGEWDGRAPITLSADAAGDLPVVVLVQAGDMGPILGAAQLR
ncbi:thioredoxin family protein [uncultured Roseobacter sp.]|uniref:DUF1223 domain-containing protein n=1 Tax=uncultured Roseobacter sp. TaxID=114847 RepID=UPI002612836D|nr:DUF1223 domain-containing protein [uncultured Roseobacter sp.]